jgi:hypothetical protein
VRVGEQAHAAERPREAYRPEPQRETTTPLPPLPGASPPPDPAAAVMSGMARMRRYSLRALAIPAAIVTLVNIFTWHGEFWAAWPLLFLATTAAFIWITGQGGPVRRYGPAVIISAMLIGINILAGGDTLWAQWPVLGIAIVTAIRWAATRSNNT